MRPLLLAVLLAASTATASDAVFPSAPLGEVVSRTERTVRPGVVYTELAAADPMRVHALVLDISNPAISLRACLAQDSVQGTETVGSMVARKGALAGVNGDYWTHNGVPLNLTVLDGLVAIAPKHRTAFAILDDGTPTIDIWTDGWSWQSQVAAPSGARRDIVMLNSDCNPGWLCLYNDFWGRLSRGDTVSPVTEVVLDAAGKVLEVRTDQPGVPIPAGGHVLTGRDDAGAWLVEHFKPGETATLDIRATKPLDNIREAIGAGPRILKDGAFFQDPIALFPAGEEFELSWKRMHYLERQPRTAVGVSRDRKSVVLLAVEGRMPQRSLGIYQREMAQLLLDFGAWDGMDLDSGGSTTMIVEGALVNRVSDKAKPDGTGGRERPVCNALLVYYAE